MTPMEQWAVVYSAYKKASVWMVLIDACKKCKVRIKLYLGIFIIFFVVLFYAILVTKSKLLIGTLFIWVIGLGFTVEKTLRDAYEPYYKEEGYRRLIKHYKPEREFFRYLYFKEAIKKDLEDKASVNYEKMRPFIEKELELAESSILARQPVIIFICSIFTAVAGGAASIKEGWSSGITPLIIYLAFIILYPLWSTVGLIKGKEYKLRELEKFIFWLENENPNIKP